MKSQSLSVSGDPAVAEADGERMRQVLVNLVANAIKFTPEGGHIRVETGDGGATVSVSVRDDGIGIDEADQPLIFERFYRTDKSRDRRTGGTGIGLTIAKSIVLAHRGTIGVESRKGEGSVFTVTLPKKQGRNGAARLPRVEQAPHAAKRLPQETSGSARRPVARPSEETKRSHLPFPPCKSNDEIVAVRQTGRR